MEISWFRPWFEGAFFQTRGGIIYFRILLNSELIICMAFSGIFLPESTFSVSLSPLMPPIIPDSSYNVLSPIMASMDFFIFMPVMEYMAPARMRKASSLAQMTFILSCTE